MNAANNARAWLHGEFDGDPRGLIKGLLEVIDARAIDSGGCAPPVLVSVADDFQGRTRAWLLECFGPTVAGDITERCDRFIEEAFELVQSLGYDSARIDALKAYTWNRSIGEPSQEVGGVMVTLAALCAMADLDIQQDGEKELTRIAQPAVMEKIRAKQAAKARDIPFSPLPAAVNQGEGGEPCGCLAFCEIHGREYIEVTPDGEEYCHECSSDDDTGELCSPMAGSCDMLHPKANEFERAFMCPSHATEHTEFCRECFERDEQRRSQPACQSVEVVQLRAEVERLNAIINTPQADDFLRAVSTEAEHQRQRWGSEHDAGKMPADWFWLIGYLAGKALHATMYGLDEKGEHHVITAAAACANWHRAMKGETNMRPGIDGEAALAAGAHNNG